MGQPTFLETTIGIDFPALSIDVSIQADRGDIIGLVGPNGSGKTSILRAIAGLHMLDRGRIEIDANVVDEPETSRFVAPPKREVGLVFQDYRLFPTMTALDNVAFGLRSTIGKKAARLAAAGWLDRFDLGKYANDRPSALSGGQSQRVALARALATRPKVLLLDEPLAAIDADSRSEIRDNLASYLEDFDGVTVLVSHDADDVRSLATHVVRIENGRLSPA